MVAIKDTEMPKSCLECRLTYPRWDFNIGCKCCNAIIGRHEEYGEYKNKRHPECPLVEIVTCSECNNWEGNNFGTGYCSIKKKYKRSYDYCSEAQRRVDDSY